MGVGVLQKGKLWQWQSSIPDGLEKAPSSALGSELQLYLWLLTFLSHSEAHTSHFMTFRD